MGPDALRCHICPKQPNFSDVSHLLTHVSSKAHLSHYFRLQVRSHQDSHAGDLLREYDRWYKANDLAKLLADRMASKEARKKKPSAKPTVHTSVHSGKRSNEYRPMRLDAPPSRSPLPDFVDPRLSRSYLNAGPIGVNAGISFAANHISHGRLSDSGRASCLREDYPPLPTAASDSAPSTKENLEYQREKTDLASAGLHSTGWHKCTLDRMNKADATPHFSRSRLGCDPFVDEHDTQGGLDIPDVDKERADEIMRLKGVLWPGMDIFDSATEQMRRRRNQKKDDGILRMMEWTSLCVAPTELVFSPTGILRKQRVISGEVEDSSPLKGESPIPRRRSARSKRGALFRSDSNAACSQEAKRLRRNSSYDLRKRQRRTARARLVDSPSPTSSLPTHHLGNNRDVSEANERPDCRHRTDFAIFHDQGGKYGVGYKGDYHESKVLHGSPGYEAIFDGLLQPSATSSYTSSLADRVYFSSGKENVEPVLGPHSRIDPLISWNSPFLRRPDDENGHPPKRFFGDPPRGGLGGFDGLDLFTGYSCNPLAMSLPKYSNDSKHIYTGDASVYEKTQAAPGPGSPDATITDIEQEDFEKLYLDECSY